MPSTRSADGLAYVIVVSGSISITRSEELRTSEANRAWLCWISRSSVSAALSSASATCDVNDSRASSTVRGSEPGALTTMMPASSSRIDSGATKALPCSSGSDKGTRSTLSLISTR